MCLETRLSKDEVFETLRAVVEPKKEFRSILFDTEKTKIYEGYIFSDSFEVRRIMRSSSWFIRPLMDIYGSVEEKENGSLIKISIKPIKRFQFIIWVLVIFDLLFGLAPLFAKGEIVTYVIIYLAIIAHQIAIITGLTSIEIKMIVGRMKRVFKADIVKDL